MTCDIHPWMKAYWMVLDNPYFAVTDDKGNFEIKNVPAGTQKVVVWQEACGRLRHGRRRATRSRSRPGDTTKDFTIDAGKVKPRVDDATDRARLTVPGLLERRFLPRPGTNPDALALVTRSPGPTDRRMPTARATSGRIVPTGNRVALLWTASTFGWALAVTVPGGSRAGARLRLPVAVCSGRAPLTGAMVQIRHDQGPAGLG